MADDTTEEEPSIEEILDSIRQIISDDDEEGADGDALSEVDAVDEPEVTADPEPEEDVIELTDTIDELEVEQVPEPESEPEEASAQDIDDIFDDPIEEPEPPAAEPEAEPESEPEILDIAMDEPSDEDNVLTGIAESAALDGFEKLVKKTAIEYNGITIEEIVRTELKPLLREWLDDNLPSMIERLVQEELERVSKRVLGDN